MPYLWGIFAAIDDPDIRTVVMMKAAQIGWTFGLIGYIGKRIVTDPCPIVALFPKEGAAREFSEEKLAPAIKATPVLDAILEVGTSRKDGNRATKKLFPGGFLKLVGSNSISNVKSTPAPLVIVEEPDDTSENLKEQGDAIRLVRERFKRYRRSKLILGGTPSAKGLSRVEEQIGLTDQRVLPIACHDCGESHVLSWDNVTWQERESGQPHPVYGMSDPESASYACPHCGTVWDDWQRKQNVLNTVREASAAGDPFCGWTPTVETSGGAVGFKELSELYVCLPGTGLADVVRDFLEAEYDASRGDESGRIVFVNSKLGRPYEYTSGAPEREQLEAKALEYAEKAVPSGGLVLTVGVDTQHDRLAVLIDAWGREEESWTIYAGEIFGTVVNPRDAVWQALDALLFSAYESEDGFKLRPVAISIDSSDGATSDAVYQYVRSRRRPGVQIMAVKGSSQDYGTREIFARPKPSIDTKGSRHTKASRYGLTPFLVGTHKAKDLLAQRMKLEGYGPGRWHWYKNVRPDFYDHITGEVKAPHRNLRGRRVWQQKAGQPIEFWDCKVYALHASRAAKVHLLKPAQWDGLEARLKQQDLFSAEPPRNQSETGRNVPESDQPQRKTGKFRMNRL